MILNLIGNIFTEFSRILIDLLQFPSVPTGITEAVSFFTSIMRSGIGIFNFVCPLDRISPAIDIYFTIHIIESTYRMIMWLFQKVPFIGVK